MATNNRTLKVNATPTGKRLKSPAKVTIAQSQPTAAPPKGAKPSTASRGRTTPRAPAAGPMVLHEELRDSKQARLIAMLGDPTGATVEQLMAITGWQADTIRGTISGVLRKKLGLNVRSEPATTSGKRLYRIVSHKSQA